MAILDEATADQVRWLLELFPITAIRAHWPTIRAREKRALSERIVREATREQVAQFVHAHLAGCRQHVYVFERPDDLPFPDDILDGGLVLNGGNAALFLTVSVREVMLVDDFELTTIDFLWPVRVEHVPGYWIVRCVILEKDVSSYFTGRVIVGKKGISEASVVASVSLGLAAADLHRGLKTLWDNDVVDCFLTNFTEPDSEHAVKMNEGQGIKAQRREDYDRISVAPMNQSGFRVLAPPEGGVESFTIDPSRGTLAFGRYTRNSGDTDNVIRSILQAN